MPDFTTYCNDNHVRLIDDTLVLVEPQLSVPTGLGFRTLDQTTRVIARFAYDPATNTLMSDVPFKTNDTRKNAFPMGRPFAIRHTPERWLNILENCAKHVAKTTGATHFELPSGRKGHDLLTWRGYVKQGRDYRYRISLI